MLTGSGQAANFYAVFNIAQAGDHIVSSSAIYGGTYNLFNVTMRKLGIDFTFVSPHATEEEIQAAIKPNTKAIFGETISNPSLDVLDIEVFAKVAHKNGIPLIVDNTFATPINCRVFDWGVDIVTHSTTKYMEGHASTIGGAIVDSGNFDWTQNDKFPGLTTPDESYHGIVYADTFGKGAYITKATVQLMRDLGSVQSPNDAFLLNVGLESLHLRMQRHCENALKVAKYLQNHPKVTWVKCAMLEDDAQHALAKNICQTAPAALYHSVSRAAEMRQQHLWIRSNLPQSLRMLPMQGLVVCTLRQQLTVSSPTNSLRRAA